jgi:selenide, water dikinase
VSCDAASVGAVLDVFKRHGFAHAAEIGSVQAHTGGPHLIVR